MTGVAVVTGGAAQPRPHHRAGPGTRRVRRGGEHQIAMSNRRRRSRPRPASSVSRRRWASRTSPIRRPSSGCSPSPTPWVRCASWSTTPPFAPDPGVRRDRRRLGCGTCRHPGRRDELCACRAAGCEPAVGASCRSSGATRCAAILGRFHVSAAKYGLDRHDQGARGRVCGRRRQRQRRIAQPHEPRDGPDADREAQRRREAVADAVAFLAGPAGGDVTGQLIEVGAER